MIHIRKPSPLVVFLMAGLAGLCSAPLALAEPVGQYAERTPQEAGVPDPAASEMETVIFDVCVPVVRGADVADTPGYEALGRPPIVDGSFKTSTGITVTPSGCSFAPAESWQPGLFSFLLPLENQDQSREVKDWNPIPLRVGEAYHQFISRDARVGITIDRNYESGVVFAYASTPQDVARHYAAVWAAGFNPPGPAAVLAFDACSSFMDAVTSNETDDTTLADVATEGRFGNTGAQVRGNIDASLWPARDGCEVVVQGAGLQGAIGEALARPDSGWSKVTETSWTRDDGGRVALKADGDVLHYIVHPGDFARHDWPPEAWDWRGAEDPADPAASGA
jgi:hypothetical protein